MLSVPRHHPKTGHKSYFCPYRAISFQGCSHVYLCSFCFGKLPNKCCSGVLLWWPPLSLGSQCSHFGRSSPLESGLPCDSPINCGHHGTDTVPVPCLTLKKAFCFYGPRRSEPPSEILATLLERPCGEAAKEGEALRSQLSSFPLDPVAKCSLLSGH